MDPCEKEVIAAQKAVMELGKQDARPALGRLSAKWHELQSVASAKIPHKKRIYSRDEYLWCDVSRTKSQRVAQFARDHKPSRPVKIGLGVLALAGFVGGLFWRRFRR